MQLLDVVQQIIEVKSITPSMENQINGLLASRLLDNQEVAALGELVDVLLDGAVQYREFDDTAFDPYSRNRLTEMQLL